MYILFRQFTLLPFLLACLYKKQYPKGNLHCNLFVFFKLAHYCAVLCLLVYTRSITCFPFPFRRTTSCLVIQEDTYSQRSIIVTLVILTLVIYWVLDSATDSVLQLSPWSWLLDSASIWLSDWCRTQLFGSVCSIPKVFVEQIQSSRSRPKSSTPPAQTQIKYTFFNNHKTNKNQFILPPHLFFPLHIYNSNTNLTHTSPSTTPQVNSISFTST